MQAPDTQSTSTGVASAGSRAGRLCRDIGFPGSTRVSQELRPATAVVKSGKRRADGWMVPSAFRMRGPATATSGWLSSQFARRQHGFGLEHAVGIEQQDELR